MMKRVIFVALMSTLLCVVTSPISCDEPKTSEYTIRFEDMDESEFETFCPMPVEAVEPEPILCDAPIVEYCQE